MSKVLSSLPDVERVANAVGDLLKPIAPARDQQQIIAAGREAIGIDSADAGGRAGDDGELTVGKRAHDENLFD